MKVLFSLFSLCFFVVSLHGQVNLKELAGYEEVQVKTESNFNPSVLIVLEDKDFDKLLVGEKLSTFLEMNDFKIVSKQAGDAAEKAYLFRFNYEFVPDKKKCGGTVIKSISGKILDMKRQDVVATFSFEQKRNKICTDDIAKILAYKLKRGS